jgi:hypothetical protein
MRRLINLAALSAALSFLVAVYVRRLRPLQMHWGATAEETGRPMPGDDLVPQATWNATRAVTVSARPEHIWPFLVQIGWGRAGWYGYDWVDNGGRPSAWEVLPEHQNVAVGKEFPMSPWTAMRCVDLKEGRWMLWRGGAASGTWLWYLDPIDEGHTRLITRLRDHYRWASPVVLPQQLLTDIGDFPFMRRCLLGVKARAERLAAQAG